MILACQNVADTLRALQADAEALKASADAGRAPRKPTFDLAQRQRALGTISLVAVLNAEQAYRQAELALVQARGESLSPTRRACFRRSAADGGIARRSLAMSNLVATGK